jgi:peroxiredoxin
VTLALLGLALAIAGPAAYFGLTFATALPQTLVEHPWPFEALSIGGFVLAALGSFRAFRAHRRRKRSLALTFLTVIGGIGLLGYIHWLSSRLPEAPSTFAQGTTPPPFTLPTTAGGQVTVAGPRAQPLVLVFYRGHWCAFCRTELANLAGHAESLRTAGAEIVAVSSDSIAQSEKLVASLSLPFALASDADLAVIKAWDLVDPMVGTYARPATIVVGRDGKIAKAWFPGDWRVRVPPEDIVAAVKKL